MTARWVKACGKLPELPAGPVDPSEQRPKWLVGEHLLDDELRTLQFDRDGPAGPRIPPGQLAGPAAVGRQPQARSNAVQQLIRR